MYISVHSMKISLPHKPIMKGAPEMLKKLRSMIQGVEADYADIRYEVKTETQVKFNGREIKSVGSSRTDGYVVRVGKDGGFSSATVTRESDVPRAVEMALEGARTVVKTGGKKTELAEVPAVRETVALELNGDPQEIEIDEKI